MIENTLMITTLTVGVVIFAVVVGIRALALAMALESGCVWVCRTIGHDCVMKVLFGITTVTFILAILKAWSIPDAYMDYWVQMSPMFRMRSMSYLAENYGLCILGYSVITMIKSMTRCSTSLKYNRLKRKLSKIKDRRKKDIPVDVERRVSYESEKLSTCLHDSIT